jgi:hypothetical protein
LKKGLEFEPGDLERAGHVYAARVHQQGCSKGVWFDIMPGLKLESKEKIAGRENRLAAGGTVGHCIYDDQPANRGE